MENATKQCNGCTHKSNKDGGWCYMFKDKPTSSCAQRISEFESQKLSEDFIKNYKD